MKKKRIAVVIVLVITMLMNIATTTFAATYTPVDPDDQGIGGIVGGDTLTFTEDTVWANLTARWGVRIIFQDSDEWNNTELQNELLPVTDSAAGSTTAPDDPSHDGWTFTGWERVDENNGPSTLSDDGTVTGINGPGPIIYQAVYESVLPKTGNLTVSKTVTGNAADTTKDFTFTVTLSDTSINGEFGDMAFKEGIATFTLKGGESLTAKGLPAGASYIVTESDNEGYEVTKSNDTGTIKADSETTVIFTNKKDIVPNTNPNKPSEPIIPKTGDNNSTMFWVNFFLALVIGLNICFIIFANNKHIRKHTKILLILVMIGVISISSFNTTKTYAEGNDSIGYTYGQYDMSYLPGTADTVTNMPEKETGLIPGSENSYTVSSTVPQREGFEFIDWELTWGTMQKPATYQVTYVVNPDPTYGAPEDSVTPVDENNPYEYMAKVTVKEDLFTMQPYAVVGGEYVGGVWGFESWDKEDFQITEDTTITGSWHFVPDNPNH